MKSNQRSRQIIISLGLFICGLFLSNCNLEPPSISLEKEQQQEQQTTKIDYGRTIIQEASDHVIIPVGIIASSQYKFLRSQDFYSKSSLYSGQSLLINNLIFHHKKTHENKLLLNSKAIISQFDYLNNAWYDANYKKHGNIEQNKKSFPKYIIYKIIQNDTNQDRQLNQEDAEIGYLSDRSGNNLTRITPQNTQLQSWQFDPSREILILSVIEDLNGDKYFEQNDLKTAYIYKIRENKLLQRLTPVNTKLIEFNYELTSGWLFIKIRKDSNLDNQFTTQDEINILKINIEQPETSIEIINDELRNQIESLIIE